MGRLLNYGLIEKKSKGYRKALRQCKKNKRLYGASFDNSETWYLDIVFYKYCKDRLSLIVQDVNNDILQHINKNQLEDVCNFLVPRLKAYKDITMAYPLDLTWEQWEDYIQNTIDEMEQKKTINLFLDRIRDFVW